MSESELILELKNIKNYYSNQSSNLFGNDVKKEVLKGVSFSVKRGEIFGLVGESGCGKSTLGRSILGLIDYEGEILIDNEKLGKRLKKEQRKKVQVVFQDPLSSLNPRKKIGFILEEPLKIHKIGNKTQRSKKVNEILELIGLDSSYRGRYPHELSGGQRQRICIGSALMLSPELIIADEAVSSLDVSVASQILNLLSGLHKRLNLSMLFISHNLNVVYYLCDRIAVMFLGSIVEMGSAEDIYSSPKHPYTKALLSAIPDIEEGKYDISKGRLYEVDEKLIQSEKGCVYCSRCPYSVANCRLTVPELIDVSEKGKEPHLVRCHLLKSSI